MAFFVQNHEAGAPLYSSSSHRILLLAILQNPEPDPHILQISYCGETYETRIQKLLRHSEMAENFLSQILIDDNRVESEVNAQCCICLEQYGTLKERGMTECEIRLHGDHTVGSMCAWTWLKTNNNNNCPQCRKVLFPADPNPHDIMEDVVLSLPLASSEPDSSDDETVNSSDDDDESTPGSPLDDTVPELFDEDAETFSDEMKDGCENLFAEEDVFMEALCVAEPIADALKGSEHEITDGYSLDTIAATTIYIASHLLGYPKSYREVARELEVEEFLICSLYTNIYDNKEDLIDLIGTYDIDGVLDNLAPFSWPPLSSESTDSQAGDDGDQAEDDSDQARHNNQSEEEGLTHSEADDEET